ncbi:MAG: hypothetical protein ACRDKY_06985 [Solirubrobacteraceae bacterium]
MSVTGGAITWARFAQARMPADQAVAVTPNTELVTIGAVALVCFGVIGVLAVLTVYLLDNEGTPGKQNQWGVLALAVAGVAVAIFYSEPSTGGLIAALVLTGIAAATVANAGAAFLKRRSNKARFGPSFAVVLVVVALAGALRLITGEWWVAAMTAAAALLAVGLLAVARSTGTNFRWFGVGVFLAVLIFGALMTTLRTASATKLQSIAVLMNEEAGGRGISGLYVAETPERIYLADVDHCKRHDLVLTATDHPIAGTGRIIAIPRASVESLAIGTRERLQLAQKRGPHLLTELRKRGASGSLPQTRPIVTPHPCADEGVVDLTKREFTQPPAKRAAQLASHFRPILRFDREEHWRPLNIAVLMAEQTPEGKPRHNVCSLIGKDRQSDCEPLAGGEDLADEQGPNRIIDFHGSALTGSDHRGVAACPPPQKSNLFDCDHGPAAAMYYRVTESGGRMYVDYWWFLRFNDFADKTIRTFCESRIKRRLIGCFNHEGDWEGVTVVSAKRQPEKLAFVDMASHEGVFRYSAAELERRGDRPIVYPANGSHASYPHACPGRCKQPNGRLPETNSDGKAPWGANDDCPVGACLIALPAKSFNAFAGRWGGPVCTPKKRCMFAAGPKTPSRQRRYQKPWCFTAPGPRLACDGTPPRE